MPAPYPKRISSVDFPLFSDYCFPTKTIFFNIIYHCRVYKLFFIFNVFHISVLIPTEFTIYSFKILIYKRFYVVFKGFFFAHGYIVKLILKTSWKTTAIS